MINPYAHTFMIATRTETPAKPRLTAAPKKTAPAKKRPVFNLGAALRD